MAFFFCYVFGEGRKRSSLRGTLLVPTLRYFVLVIFFWGVNSYAFVNSFFPLVFFDGGGFLGILRRGTINEGSPILVVIF